MTTAAAALSQTARAAHGRWTEQIDPVRPLLELGGVALTAALHLGWPLLGLPRGVLVVPLVACWVGYIAVRTRVNPEAVAAWGLRREGLRPALLATLAVMAVGAAGMGAIGLVLGASVPPAYAAICLLTYPIWGLIQQLLVQGLVTGNLAKLPGRWGHPAVATVVSATLFGLVHYPHPELMVGTFLLGLTFAPIWLRWRNLWPLALAHGWLGTMIYYVVLMQDPMATYFAF